jgi:hypothetical protein
MFARARREGFCPVSRSFAWWQGGRNFEAGKPSEPCWHRTPQHVSSLRDSNSSLPIRQVSCMTFPGTYAEFPGLLWRTMFRPLTLCFETSNGEPISATKDALTTSRGIYINIAHSTIGGSQLKCFECVALSAGSGAFRYPGCSTTNPFMRANARVLKYPTSQSRRRESPSKVPFHGGRYASRPSALYQKSDSPSPPST